jgi:integration host factor subunit beta
MCKVLPEQHQQPSPDMTRAELIQKIATRYPQLTATDVDMAVRVIVDAMSRALSKGGRIEVRGFGSFGINYRPPRKGRNPKTGASVMVPAKYMPHFKAGKELRDRVDTI